MPIPIRVNTMVSRIAKRKRQLMELAHSFPFFSMIPSPLAMSIVIFFLARFAIYPGEKALSSPSKMISYS